MHPRILLSLLALLLLPAAALAGGSSAWEVVSQEAFDRGTLQGVVTFAPGGLRPGPTLGSLSVEEVAVWRTFLSPAGELYVGTAKNASVYKLEGGTLRRILQTDELAVTDLLLDNDGNVYASTIPHGRIYRIPPQGEASVFQLPSPYPWRILFGPDGNLYVASGPEGKVYLMEKGGGWTKEIFASDREKNIISMALERSGSLLLGTAEHGILYRLRPDRSVEAVHNFPEKEIRDIAVYDGGTYVATNISQKSFDQTQFISELAAVLASEARGSAQPGSRKRFKKLLDGKVYHIDPQGRVETVLALSDTFLLALGVARDGSVLAGAGAGGRVYSVDRRGTRFTLVDLDEEQVMSLAMLHGELLALGTGHPGRLYRVERPAALKGVYLSEVLDTGFPSSFGRFFWEGRGTVTVQTRTGNTAEPDETWSEWSAPLTRPDTPVASPRGRFFQFRVNFGADPAAVVTRTRLHFTRANQRPFIERLVVGAAPEEQPYRLGEEEAKPKMPVKVEAGDPDGDPLVFRLYYRLAGTGRWVGLNEDQPVSKPAIEWVVTDMPDGQYQLKVVASDERANTPAETLTAEKTSPFFVIDNRRPAVEDLSVNVGNEVVLRGRAVDASSHITRIEYAVDDGPWRFVYPEDRVFDAASERFRAVLPALPPGLHRLRVRAKDRAGNLGVAEIEFDTR